MIRGESSITIAAPTDAVWAVLSDFEGYTGWHPFFASVAAHERDAGGRVTAARCTHGTPVGPLTTELEVRYDDMSEVEARRVGGDMNAMSGVFALVTGDGGVRVTHTLLVDPGFRLGLLLRGPVEERVRRSVLNGALSGLELAVAAGS